MLERSIIERKKFSSVDFSHINKKYFNALVSRNFSSVDSTMRTELGSDIYEVMRTPITLGNEKNADFIILAIRKEREAIPSVLSFFYFDNEKKSKIASLRFVQEAETSYHLEHRLVAPEYRNNNIGTKLLNMSEDFFGHLATETKSDISLLCNTAQVGVMRWISRAGYQPIIETEKNIAQQAMDRADVFQYRSLLGSDGMTRDDYIFEKDATEFTVDRAVRIRFEKIICAE